MKRPALILAFIIAISCSTNADPVVYGPVLAGRWYPSNKGKLTELIDGLLSADSGHRPAAKPMVLIVPHAGYAYSGKVAAAGFRTLRNRKPEIVVIIAPSHHGYFYGCALLNADYYETPLGRVRLDRGIINELSKNKLFAPNEGAFRQEHSIEIELPFLQRLYRDSTGKRISIVPILVGEIGSEDALNAANQIWLALAGKKEALFIISSDFTHYGPNFGYMPFSAKSNTEFKEKLHGLDFGAIDPILKLDPKKFLSYCDKTRITVCGKNAIQIALSMPLSGFKADLISYGTSANITGDYSNSVSYASVLIAEDPAPKPKAGPAAGMEDLSASDKKFLLRLARQSIESLLFKKQELKINESSVPAACKRSMAAFVTLNKNGGLRGCIGYIQPVMPLYKAVIGLAAKSAFEDRRFEPLSPGELKHISIEISVLTVPRQIKSPEEVAVGRDGLIMEQGALRGVYLPQVPVEWGWNREEYLIQTCRKAGLPDYAWKHGAKMFTFQTIIFGEDTR